MEKNAGFISDTFKVCFENSEIVFQPRIRYTINFRYTGIITCSDTGVFAVIDPDFLHSHKAAL